MAKYNVDRISRINKNLWNAAKKQRDRVEKRPLPKVKFEKTDFGMIGDNASNRFNEADKAAFAWGIQPGAAGGGMANKGQQKNGGINNLGNPNF